MFIRIKKRKNTPYAYLVENRWYKTHQQSRQKVKKYLGKVHTPEKAYSQTLEKYLAIKTKNIDEYIQKTQLCSILLDLICLELKNHRFKQIKRNLWQQQNINIDLKNKKIYDNITKKPVCIELNNNFLTELTLTKLLNFQPPNQSTRMQIGKALANTILESGINVKQEVFLQICNKMYNRLK